jgi:group II intron reverse transcriptase/maturase
MPVRKTGKTLTESLQGISNRVQKDSEVKVQSLYGFLNEQNMIDCYPLLKKKASPGVDKVSVKEYGINLEANVSDLVTRLKRNGYRPHLVKRIYIPKGNGKERPLGIPAVEDKLLQICVSKILNAIYEPLFLDYSFGYRPNRSPHDAIHSLEMDLQYGRASWVVDADIESYFDSIDHDKLLSMLEYKIADRPFIRLIRKWLKAGILDVDGAVMNPATGCPQGGVVTP